MRSGVTKEGNQDSHIRVALDVVQNVRIDGNEDSGTEHAVWQNVCMAKCSIDGDVFAGPNDSLTGAT